MSTGIASSILIREHLPGTLRKRSKAEKKLVMPARDHLEACTDADVLVELWLVQEGLSSQTTAGRMDERAELGPVIKAQSVVWVQ